MAGPGLEQLINRLANATELDPVAEDIGKFWTTVLRWQRLRDVLSGRQLGHALHPAAALVTGGALFSATVLDVAGDDSARPRHSASSALGCCARHRRCSPAGLTGSTQSKLKSAWDLCTPRRIPLR